MPVRHRHLLASIGKTIAPLPDGLTAVPYTAAGADVAVVADAMRALHLTVRKPAAQPGTQQMVVATHPRAGTVVRRDSTVQLRVQSYTTPSADEPPAPH